MDTMLYCKDPNNKGCTWSGESDELIALSNNANDNDFTHCPNCDGDDFDEEDIEDDDDEEEDDTDE